MTLSSFTPESASGLAGPEWLVRRRAAAAEVFSASPLPTEKDEVWRYSRIDELDLDRYRPLTGPPAVADGLVQVVLEAARRFAGEWSGLVATFGGTVVHVEGPTARGAADDSVHLGRLSEHRAGAELLGSVASEPRDFTLLNEAFAPDPVVVDVAPTAHLDAPVVIVHVVGTGGPDPRAVFPRTLARVGEGAEAGLVELVVSAAGGAGPGASDELLVPVTELVVADGAELRHVAVQDAPAGVWCIGRQVSTIGKDATLRSYAVATGGTYARLRTDSTLSGEGGTSELRAAYVGTDDQMLDFRTMQDHAAPRTRSDLLFKGAVRDRAHSVYSGLIRVRRGAVKADAMQTNHNLVLDDGAHADSVPNLDIEENDVRCSHGSTVGPVDEDQRYYLESRGVPPEAAEELIVTGFFADIAAEVPLRRAEPGVRGLLTAALGQDIGRLSGGGSAEEDGRG